MKTLDLEIFEAWLQEYSRASRDNDARASAGLFSQNAAYHESPFDEPIVGRDAIFKYWDGGARALKDKDAAHEILAVKGNLGIARWQSKFTEITSGRRLALDCLFLVEFDEDNLCCVFREWWHLRVLDDPTGSKEQNYPGSSRELAKLDSIDP
jgi:hypothetical protein